MYIYYGKRKRAILSIFFYYRFFREKECMHFHTPEHFQHRGRAIISTRKSYSIFLKSETAQNSRNKKQRHGITFAVRIEWNYSQPQQGLAHHANLLRHCLLLLLLYWCHLREKERCKRLNNIDAWHSFLRKWQELNFWHFSKTCMAFKGVIWQLLCEGNVASFPSTRII